MEQTPAITRTVFPDISSRAWEHPADRTALTALRRLKGFDQILKVLSGMLRERKHRLLYLASSARVGPRQFADLDALLEECVQVLDECCRRDGPQDLRVAPRQQAGRRVAPGRVVAVGATVSP